jgi:RHS repeat-associated protein
MGTHTYGFAYDPIGNRTAATNAAEATAYAANALNQHSSISHPSYVSYPSHDLDGNLTNDAGWAYTWDAENRLIAVTTRADLPATVPRVRLAHAYDYMSRRHSTVISLWTNGDWQVLSTNLFVYDGWNVIRQLSNCATGQLSDCSFAWGLDLSGSLQGAGGIGGLLFGSFGGTNSAKSAMYCYDANGNVGQLLAVSSPTNILARYEYGPFGQTVAAAGPLAEANPFRFSTKYHDAGDGLVYYGYRYYAPQEGRWASRDHTGGRGTPNLLSFIGNNGIQFLDFLGLTLIDPSDPGRPWHDSPTIWGAIAQLRHDASRPHVGLGLHDKKVYGEVTPGTTFESCDICPTPPYTVFVCVASGRWTDASYSTGPYMPFWENESTASPDDRLLWQQIMMRVRQHEEGHLTIFHDYAARLNWSFQAVAISCTSQADACGTASADLDTAHEVHFGKVGVEHKANQESYDARDTPLVYRAIDDLVARYHASHLQN